VIVEPKFQVGFDVRVQYIDEKDLFKVEIYGVLHRHWHYESRKQALNYAENYIKDKRGS